MMAILLSAMALLGAEPGAAPKVHFQSHRGGLEEAPENTLAAVEHSWNIPGAVPEVDLVTTSDGAIVCLHDRTLERTTDAPAPDSELFINEMTYDRIRQHDAGVKFGEQFKGTPVPALEEVFIRMVGKPERELYLDLKAIELDALAALIDRYNLRNQVLFVHGVPTMCRKLSQLWPGARVMTWISDPPEVLMKRFEKMAEEDFFGVKQLQFHLHAQPGGPPYVYELDDAYLKAAIERLAAKGIALQIRPFEFDAESLGKLIDLGVFWYVTDAPKKFSEAVQAASVIPAKAGI
jgi:glycerophosphoryl diester phosphodiesterase